MYIGIDLGGTNIGIGIVDSNNDLIYKDEIPTRKEIGYTEIIRNMIGLIYKSIDIANIKKNEIKGIGIGIPGIIDPKSGKIIDCVNLKWKNIDIKGEMEDALNIPVFVGNDATVAGVAELAVGAMQGVTSGILLTLGTGVGAGIIINGNVYDGANGIGAEVGHMVVGENYHDCNCGRNGCLETFCSSTAIINYSIKLLEEGVNSSILEHAGGDISKIDGR
ncbi:MAG: ROK family protein, partial [Clostridium sp.]